jgi:hypothetical protein
MCHLLDDPSADVQILAYQFLKEAAKKRTEHFVIEAGVDAEATVKAELPLELMDILRRTPPLRDEHEADDEVIICVRRLGSDSHVSCHRASFLFCLAG